MDTTTEATRQPLSEDELDLHIRDCGRRMTAAFAAGDREDGCQWRDRMYEAIRSRTPEHQARLTARIDSAIWFQSPEALAMGEGGALNFYERHIGDYIKKTSHLSLLEHGVLTRLRDVYLDREEPIPEARAARLVGARTEPETEALQVVLQEFFQLRDGMWVCDECEALIAAYAAGEPEREVKKANEDNRLKRHRQERAALFKLLTDRGEHAPWNIGMEELRQRVAALQVPGPETPAATQPATAPATPATATHYPLPTTQSPGIGKQGADAPLSPAAQPTGDEQPQLTLTGEPDAPPETPPCPLKQLVGMYAARLPELPKPRYELWKDGEGAEAMRQRWKWLLSTEATRDDGSRYATTAAEGLDWFSRFFDSVAGSDLLMGRKSAWRADLAWLMKRANFTKVVQGNYVNRETP